MINAFQVNNLRSISDSGVIRLAKINVLVGKNSAGKSTLLRVLPLLRQSVEQPTKAPILWYGRLVDFGTYQNAVSSFAREQGVKFDFYMNLSGDANTGRSYEREYLFGSTDSARIYKSLPKVKVSLTIGLDDDDDVGRARSIEVDLGPDLVKVTFNQGFGECVVMINGEPVALPPKRQWLVQSGKLLLIPLLAKEEIFSDTNGTQRSYLATDMRPFLDQLTSSLAPMFHGNTSGETVAELASNLLYSNDVNFYEQLVAYSSIAPSFAQNISLRTPKDEYLGFVRKQLLLSSLTGLFRRIDKEISDFSANVKYVEPIRATAERYYRLQDLAVDEIDSRGENTAMFLNSLPSHEKQHLRQWMLKHLGFYADVEQSTGHVQVKIGDQSGRSKNIADLGFGYSQLLPIILQIWRSLASPVHVRRRILNSIIAIEQPELHLHPQFQAQIADVLAAVLIDKPGKPSGSIFLETHSEHILNRLGQLISSGKLRQSDVQVLVVEPSNDGRTKVRTVGYDENGFLDSSWPSGFFVPEAVQ